MLSMHREARAAVLAALREVYDGAWTRHVGTDGGQALEWRGKVGLLAGSTQSIDRHHAVMSAMGERFLLFRLPEVDTSEQARWALAHAGHEEQMRTELASAVVGLFERGLAEPRELSDEEREQLVLLSTLIVRCRRAVERDSYTREVELVPDPEAPTRLIVVLSRLLAGLDAIGATREDAWRVVTRVALDSIPALRLAVIDVLFAAEGDLASSVVAGAVRHPTLTARRALEDLTAHGVVERHTHGDGKSHTWTLTEWTRARYRAVRTASGMSGGSQPTTESETSAGLSRSNNSLSNTEEDISDSVPSEVAAAERERGRVLSKWEDA